VQSLFTSALVHHGTLGFYLRDALREGSANAAVCHAFPLECAGVIFSSALLLCFAWWLSLLFLVNFFLFG
jgi:hypothetical protein